MIFNIEGQLLETIIDRLAENTIELARSRERINQLEENQLLTEVETQAYLKRDAVTIRFYRKIGLPFYKKGRDVWYLKSDIDAWLDSGKVNRHNR